MLKTEKQKRIMPGMSVGSSSILVTFVLLCLVTFAALSFVSAKADKKLSTQTANRIKAYYEATSTAEFQLANIDAQLSSFAKKNSEEDYFTNLESLFSDNEMYEIIRDEENPENVLIHYEIDSLDNQKLCVSLKVLYPNDDNDELFKVTQWEILTVYTPSNDSLMEEKGGLLF